MRLWLTRHSNLLMVAWNLEVKQTFFKSTFISSLPNCELGSTCFWPRQIIVFHLLDIKHHAPWPNSLQNLLTREMRAFCIMSDVQMHTIMILCTLHSKPGYCCMHKCLLCWMVTWPTSSSSFSHCVVMEIHGVNKAKMTLTTPRLPQHACTHRQVAMATVTKVTIPAVRTSVRLHAQPI